MTTIIPPATPTGIEFAYDGDGEVQCRNQRGLIFFLRAELPAPAPRGNAGWQPVAATQEVAVRRESEPRPIAEVARPLPDPRNATWKPVDASREVEVRRPEAARPAATGPLPAAPQPGKPAERGWFGKLFN